MNVLKLTGVIVACAGLAACSSGGSGDGAEFLAALDRAISADATSVGAAALPAQAELNGGFYLEDDGSFLDTNDDEVLIGQLAMTADFNGGTLTGTASNINVATATGACTSSADCVVNVVQPLTGTLTLQNGAIAAGAAQTTATGSLEGDISGTLTDDVLGDGTFVANVEVDIQNGEFLQDPAGMIFRSDLSGDAQVNTDFGGTTNVSIIPLDGEASAVE